MHKQRAFTLIELLVVIAIIALLMSILAPALSKSKRQAKAVMCLSNLHQWGLAWKMFLDKHNGWFDFNYHLWYVDMVPYYQNQKLLLCPEATKTSDQGRQNPFMAWQHNEPSGIYTGSYGLNYWVTKDESANTTDALGGDLRWKNCYVKGASYAPLLVGCTLRGACVHHWDEPPAYDGEAWPSGEGGDIDEMRRFCMNRHMGRVGGLFMDFSCRMIGLKELWELRWSREWFRTSDHDLSPNYAPPTAWDDPSHWMFGMKDYAP